MNIGIIGAGFTGLSAAHSLQKKGHKITLLEKDSYPGGLALGFKEKKWDWTLEKHYHHWFTNDNAVLSLADEIGHQVVTSRPKTSIYLESSSYQLDSPLKVMLFPELSLFDRTRMATVLGFLRLNPFWNILESINATEFLPQTMGEKAYEMIWEPQLLNKFGPFAKDISLAWFWARIKKRTPSLAYPRGGFLEFATHLEKILKKNGAELYYNTQVQSIESKKNSVIIYSDKKSLKSTEFDKVIVTLPTFLFTKIAKNLPTSYINSLKQLNGLGALNVVLRLSKPFLKDSTYWLSVCQKNSPIMAVVEHTNFIDKKHYDNEHLVYLGNYLPHNHPYFKRSAQELIKEFDPFLKKLNHSYRKNLIQAHVFQAPFAQPIIPVNYSHLVPSHSTPLPNVFLANMQQVYPWDRGTNYAVELGEKVAKFASGDV